VVINNKTKSVIVLKAIGMPNLRLFPGYNKVQETGIENYFKGNRAAQAHKKDNLAMVESDAMTAEDRIQAEKSEAKNAELNKAQRVIKVQNEKLVKDDKTISDQLSNLKSQSNQLNDQAGIIKKLQADVKKLKKARKPGPEETKE